MSQKREDEGLPGWVKVLENLEAEAKEERKKEATKEETS